jgi:hypothetical protein
MITVVGIVGIVIIIIITISNLHWQLFILSLASSWNLIIHTFNKTHTLPVHHRILDYTTHFYKHTFTPVFTRPHLHYTLHSYYALTSAYVQGKVQSISAQRFVIAVGGRPTALDCPGGELAITSDDLFMRVSLPCYAIALIYSRLWNFEELMLWSVLYCTIFFFFSSLFIYCAGFLPNPKWHYIDNIIILHSDVLLLHHVMIWYDMERNVKWRHIILCYVILYNII